MLPDFHHHPDRARRIRWVSLQLAVALPITAIASSFDRFADPNRSSYRGPGVSNHPVNIMPSSAVSIPPGWQLGPDGSMTCTTCHLAIPNSGASSGARLREAADASSNPRAFCMNCHRDSSGRTAATAHWMVVPTAHILRESFEDHSIRGSAIDGASRDCLACHDGVSALDAGYKTGLGRGSGNFSDMGRNHPVGVPYPRSGTRRVEVPLRPEAALPETVRLPGGLVSCVSCHDLYHSDKNRLSVPIEGSGLCLTCHDLN